MVDCVTWKGYAMTTMTEAPVEQEPRAPSATEGGQLARLQNPSVAAPAVPDGLPAHLADRRQLQEQTGPRRIRGRAATMRLCTARRACTDVRLVDSVRRRLSALASRSRRRWRGWSNAPMRFRSAALPIVIAPSRCRRHAPIA